MRHLPLVLALAALTTGCTSAGLLDFERVQPWQRDTLSKDAMRPGGDPADAYVDEHIYFSKEASSGGSGVGGGGCGCN